MQPNARQKLIFQWLLASAKPLTLKEISDRLQVSSRTVQREIGGIRKLLRRFRLELEARPGVGLSIAGTEEDKQQASETLRPAYSERPLTAEERQYELKQTLLSLNEPVKLFYLGRKLNVSEATVSYDLDKLEEWFAKRRIRIVRKPGFGVFLQGEEKDFRQAILELLYEQCSKEQLVEAFHSFATPAPPKAQLETSVRSHLLNFIEEHYIDAIERKVRELEQDRSFYMPDSAFVGLVVHIALALQRLVAGEKIEMSESVLSELKRCEEYEWSETLTGRLSEALGIAVPESEVGYITMHLLGAGSRKTVRKYKVHPVSEYVNDLIYIVSDELNMPLSNDEDLAVHLAQHLESVFFRISMSMQIRNPLLEQVKNNYPHVFEACKKAAAYLEKRIGFPVPDEETGYLAMHFGAAVLRRNMEKPRNYKVLVVCTSGFGASKLLAAQIRKELSHIEVADTVPLSHLSHWSGNWNEIDLLVSTVTLEFERKPVVMVSPFLTAEDRTKLETRLSALRQPPLQEGKEVPIDMTIKQVNRYGDAVSELIRNFQFVESECRSKADVIREAARSALLTDAHADVPLIERDLLHRERMGTWTAEGYGLALLHYRTKGIHAMHVSAIRLNRPVAWGEDGRQGNVRTVLILLAPDTAGQEQMEMIGEIGASLIEEEHLAILAGGSGEDIRAYMDRVLSEAYTVKMKQLIGG